MMKGFSGIYYSDIQHKLEKYDIFVKTITNPDTGGFTFLYYDKIIECDNWDEVDREITRVYNTYVRLKKLKRIIGE